MGRQDNFTGTHKIVLPANFLQSADAAAELFEEQLDAVSGNLVVQQFEQGPGRRFILYTALGLVVWLAPTTWMICS